MTSNSHDLQELFSLDIPQLPTTTAMETAEYDNDKLLHELQKLQIELETHKQHLREKSNELEELHEHYRDLFDFAPLGYVILSPQGLINNINLTGMSLLRTEDRSKLIARFFTPLVDHTDKDRWQLFFWSLMRFKVQKTIELKLRRTDNSLLHVQLNGIQVSNLKAGSGQIRLAMTDITRQKQLETVESLCERYQLAEKGSLDAIWDWDIQSDTIYCADRWYQMLGYWNNVGLHLSFSQWENLLHPDDHYQTIKQLNQHLEQRIPFVTEYRLRTFSGSYRWLLASGQAIWNEQGKPIRMSGTLIDITEHKQAEQIFINACALAEKSSQEKSDFLANISHELRTPMNLIMGMTYLAQHTQLLEKKRAYLDKVDYASQTLLSLINNILDFSKIEAGKLELEKQNFSLTEILESLTYLFEFKAKEKNIELIFSITPETPHQLTGDPLRVSQIFLNLFNNAIKFSEHGKITVSVMPLEQTAETVTLQVCVQDEGIGISAEQIEKLFLPFFQTEPSVARKYGGTGLGLSISKQLVELMGGKIWAESEPDKGSRFFFTAQFEVCNGSFSEPSNYKNADLATNLSGYRVLLVEDEALNRELMVELLTTLGLEIIIAKNGQQGVEMARNESIDLILMDIQMPEMDGLTACRLIRAEPGLQHVPIIALTAYAMNSDKEKSLVAGMNDHVIKPINPEKLSAMLVYWLKPKLPPDKIPPAPEKNLSKEQHLPDELPPFNISAALLQVGGNRQVLHKMILMFHDDFRESSKNLQQLIAEADYTEAERLAHRLHGAAMILVLDELSGIVATVERAIKSRNLNKINLCIKALEPVLEPIIKAASELKTAAEALS